MDTKLHHIVMFIGDLKRALHLFRDLLEFEVIWHQEKVGGSKLSAMLGIPGFEGEIVYMQKVTDGTAIELIHMKKPPIEHKAGLQSGALGSVGLSMQVEDIGRLHDQLTDQGWAPFSKCMELMTPRGVSIRAFCFATDEGVTIEVFQEMADN